MGGRSPACCRSAHNRWAVLAGVTPRSFGVLGLTFQFPAVLSTFQLPGVLTGADQASTAAGGDDRFDGSAVQARPGRAPGVLVAATRDAVPTIFDEQTASSLSSGRLLAGRPEMLPKREELRGRFSGVK